MGNLPGSRSSLWKQKDIDTVVGMDQSGMSYRFSVKMLLEDPELVDIFMQFLELEFAQENLMFLVDMKQLYSEDVHESMLESNAILIKDRYFNQTSALQLNLSFSEYEYVEEQIREGHYGPEVFKSSVKRIKSLLKTRLLHFTQSDIYKDMLSVRTFIFSYILKTKSKLKEFRAFLEDDELALNALEYIVYFKNVKGIEEKADINILKEFLPSLPIPAKFKKISEKDISQTVRVSVAKSFHYLLDQKLGLFLQMHPGVKEKIFGTIKSSTFSEETCALLLGSWIQLSSLEMEGTKLELSKYFYDTLFEDHPEYCELFPNIEEQYKKFMKTLSVILNSIRNIDRCKHILEHLGKFHARLNLTAEHFDIVTDAMMLTLEHFMGDNWTKKLSQAWLEALTTVSAVILDVINSSKHEEMSF
eukprot:TRINITY_DN1867_c0_g1_i1.p1 TRINITY_DN1867_c0_g1~~TRINITY_DN1867_c0_g1_i1.p1  ORF type:complete len:417 (+),score=80.58 TRINITY_DN1867_c0_g1_i1:90-1340(+)